jgi:hypothetical protein
VLVCVCFSAFYCSVCLNVFYVCFSVHVCLCVFGCFIF